MKKSILTFLLAAAVLLSATACSGQIPEQAAAKQNPYYPDNEIITVEDLNDGRMVIVIDTQYNVSTSNIGEVVEARFPEVNVLLRLQNTPDSSYYTEKSMEHRLLGDLFFCAGGMTKDEELLRENFIDLSDAPFINNYYQNALDNVAVNGKIYMLPGFADIFGIIYDRTLFQERGWDLPKNRDEFIALCKTIQAEKGYQAFMPTLKYSRMAMLLSHGFHYERVIAGVDNQRWLQAYRRGEASFSGHMEPLFAGMEELFDAGVLSDQNFTVEPGIRSAMLYKEHTSAMTMETQNAATYAKNAESDHEYGMMPFWNSNNPDSDYLVSSPGFNIYVNKRLEAPENSEKLQKVMEILAYFSTPEGQNALMTDESATISNVKGTDSTSGGAFMDNVAATIAKGNIFPEVRYTELAYNNPFQAAFREALMGYLDGTMEMDAAMAHCDQAMEVLKNAVEPEEEVYGFAAQNFTVLETSAFVADILRKEADADVALVLAKQLTYGEAGNFFEGDITDTVLKFVTLDYVSGKDPAYNQLVTVNLTGTQILSILNYPYLNNAPTDTRTVWTNYDSPSYWVPSNLKIEYAPLLPESSIISVKNMDGSEFDLAKTYKVAIWNGCFSNLAETAYFDAATLTAMGDVTPVSGKSSIDLIKAAVMDAGEISPPNDGRLTLRWDITPRSENRQ